MSNYNGARKKTFGNQRCYVQSSESSGSNGRQNNGDGWGNINRKVNIHYGWGQIDKTSKFSSEDGWEENTTPYSNDGLWNPLPGQDTAPECVWNKRDFSKTQKSYASQVKKTVPLVGPSFFWNEDDYPALESRRPRENVWEKRKEKLEGRKAMEPSNQTEEKIMIQKAIELSKREAKEEEDRKRLIEEEYELQNVILASNPQLFSDFMAPDALAEANEPETTDYQCNDNLINGYVEQEHDWNVLKPVEIPQKQNKKAGKKKKRNNSQPSMHMRDELNIEDQWPVCQKFDQDGWSQNTVDKPCYNEAEKNESQFVEEGSDYLFDWSQDSIEKPFYNEAEKNETQFVDEDSDNLFTEQTPTIPPEIDDDRKVHKDYQPKISKVIDIFDSGASKDTEDSSLKSSYKQENLESYDKHSSDNSISNNHDIFQDDFGNSKEMPNLDENWQFSKNSPKREETENASKDEKSQSALNRKDAWNKKFSSNDVQYSNELKHSLYSHVESNIAASASSSFCNAATNLPGNGDFYLPKKSVPKDDDAMKRIIDDYASLSVNCADMSTAENVPGQRKSSDIFNKFENLLNENNLEPDIIDLHPSNVGEVRSLSTHAYNQTAENEIMYTMNNPAPAKFPTETPNKDLTRSWNDSETCFPTSSERSEIKDGLFLPHLNESIQDIHNIHESNPTESTILPTVQPEINSPFQPNPGMPIGMNPLILHQMMMLNNPFFFQQLSQMEMYYRAIRMPLASPLIAPIQMSPFNPMGNIPHPISMGPNGEPYSQVNPVPGQSVESIPPISPLYHNFENGNQRSMPKEASAAPKTSAAPTFDFENSLLNDLLSEGTELMDTYIPPPTMPATNPPENKHPTPDAYMNIARDVLQNDHETKLQNPKCDMKNVSQEDSTWKHASAGVIANIENSTKTSVSDEASGWGDLDDIPKSSYDSWSDNKDVWEGATVTTSKSMIKSSIDASHKQGTVRQPIRRPRHTYQWK